MNKNSMCYWWPKIENLGIPVPKTEITTLDGYPKNIGYPLFLRTDLCSGKHDWKESCFVPSEEVLQERIQKVLDGNAAWMLLGMEPSSLVFREFLDLESSFTAFAGGMPITKERRYFINAGRVVCHHPYWPVTAFNRHPARMTDDPKWEEKLKELNKEGLEEQMTLFNYSQIVGSVMPEYWSIDFAKGKNGVWYLIDMALGENSFHWKDCGARIGNPTRI